MDFEYLSASRIKKFEQCELGYYAHYILGVEEPTHPLTNMGSSIHRMFELATIARIAGQKDSNPLEFKAQATKEFGVESNLLSLVDELTGNGIRWGYFRNVNRTAGCELKFDFVTPNGTKVKGAIDRLDVNVPNADVIDLKTQKSKFDEAELKDNWQARIYNIGARKLRPEITGKVSVSFWLLRHQVQKVWLSAEAVGCDMAALDKVGSQIRACTDPKPSPSFLCNYCGYKGQCVAGKMKAKKRW
jgi:CRISPR/Cas system-associated exonuclease Cas4 (RecB family)